MSEDTPPFVTVGCNIVRVDGESTFGLNHEDVARLCMAAGHDLDTTGVWRPVELTIKYPSGAYSQVRR